MLTREGQSEALAILSVRDAVLAETLTRFGPPPFWSRPSGFATLTLIILEQQVSLASARAAYARLNATIGEVTPTAILQAGEECLRTAGLTRQKSAYLTALAHAEQCGQLNLDALGTQGDANIRVTLTAIKGVGDWTVDVYLLLALLRPDVLPVGDLALVSAVQRAFGLPARPTREQLLHLGEAWRPWRSVATRLLWHAYLSERGKTFQG